MTATAPSALQLTLGPVLYHWSPEVWRDFYFRMADEGPLDRVVVGEAVCSKREPFYDKLLPEVVERLERAGKDVALASLILVSTGRERRMTAELANEHRLVEINDLAAAGAMAGRTHAIGPYINVYNEAAAAVFARRGAVRITLPPETPLSTVAAIAQAAPELPLEVFAFGKAPLAISARCYHARLEGLAKDNCRFVCNQDPDGLVVETLDGVGFLTMNGVQTQAHACTSLITDLEALAGAGVSALRLSPQQADMVKVAQAFRDVADGAVSSAEGQRRVAEAYPGAVFANGFLHGEAGAVRSVLTSADGPKSARDKLGLA